MQERWKVMYGHKLIATSLQPYIILHHSYIFEVSQHQSVANQQSLKSGDSLHKMANGSLPHPFSATTKKNGKKWFGHVRLPLIFFNYAYNKLKENMKLLTIWLVCGS